MEKKNAIDINPYECGCSVGEVENIIDDIYNGESRKEELGYLIKLKNKLETYERTKNEIGEYIEEIQSEYFEEDDNYNKYKAIEIEEQVEAMNKWNDDNNITNAIQLMDKATGTNTEREQLQLLLKVVGENDLVVIHSIDRLSRNYKECKQLWEQITSKGADIIVIDLPILDTRQYKDLLGSFISDLILSVLGYVAEQETEFRKQRQAEGIAIMKLL